MPTLQEIFDQEVAQAQIKVQNNSNRYSPLLLLEKQNLRGLCHLQDPNGDTLLHIVLRKLQGYAAYPEAANEQVEVDVCVQLANYLLLTPELQNNIFKPNNQGIAAFDI